MLKEKIIALLERVDDQEILLFILIILEDALDIHTTRLSI